MTDEEQKKLTIEIIDKLPEDERVALPLILKAAAIVGLSMGCKPLNLQAAFAAACDFVKPAVDAELRRKGQR